MDSFSDSSRCELDSVTSGDSLHQLNDEFRLRLSTPDLSNIELSKRVASLELENERLRVDLATLRIELNSKSAANQGLKDKITELYVDAQSALQEKFKLENNLKDSANRLASAENSTKWYQEQLHGTQANEKILQIEIRTYKELLRQKQQSLAEVTLQSKQVNQEYADLVSKFKEEKGLLHNEISNLRLRIEEILDKRTENENGVSSVPISEFTPDLSTKLEATEEELRETKSQLNLLEQRLSIAESAKLSMEKAFGKHCALISSMEDNMQMCETEKNKLAENLRESRFEAEKLRSENEAVQSSLMTSRQNQRQVEEAISQLQTQLAKMISQFKVVKARNSDLEEKVTLMQGALEESKRLKLLSFNANSSLLKKLKKEKRKVQRLENLISQNDDKRKKDEASKTEDSVKEYLKQALDENKELKEQLKSMTRISEESIDEGYADGTSLGLSSTNFPSPPALNPVLLTKITDVLSKSKHLMTPIQSGVNELQIKIEKFKEDQNLLKFQVLTPNCYNNRPISTISSPNNTRTLV
ncbi:plasminogen-binding group A streptococcal M-like protein PAM [Belonocnema kinseyi]|uniref:plasminogen-binding group A streptococcal M-like protein PAM n=1 Tax=Belonocnema kinseyi TaxID=2817044 RepID=UPI00143D1C17|nr:plasminogen-binding group A streptococcal M-like protein PAM [Belonocnema kinseyi]XP_033226473.1 plasminogen-binding group A streptococcal M-like protein PAM [Belonocnema kinseyi]XP_033226474.1 plasminogen-binding group A streptococcal M-like protein PAM [Belonocnema kinseyi]